MLQDLGWQTSDTLARAQLAMFHGVGDAAGLSHDDRRRALDLDKGTWLAWAHFQADGPRPASPPLPEMLRRVSETAFALAVVAEQYSATINQAEPPSQV